MWKPQRGGETLRVGSTGATQMGPIISRLRTTSIFRTTCTLALFTQLFWRLPNVAGGVHELVKLADLFRRHLEITDDILQNGVLGRYGSRDKRTYRLEKRRI